MKNITVGIFNDEQMGRELGKKSSESDIVMFNRKTDDCIFTFMQPVKDKLSAKSQMMSCIDFAIVSFAEITPEIGETVIMLDSFGISDGAIVTSPYNDIHQVETIIKGTSLESFTVVNRDIPKIFNILHEINSKRDIDSNPLVVIDQAFSVKGVGEVVLGFVKNGTVRKHDKFLLMPPKKAIAVRSIQMQDKDFDSAEAGSRVGLAIKGANAREIKRGFVICTPENIKSDTKIKLSFKKNRFYHGDTKEGLFHVTVGMQTAPVKITGINEDFITIESEKPLAYTQEDIFLILDLNAKKLHVVGKGKAIWNP